MEAFCSKCQSKAEHTVEVDANQEVVLTCPACGHSIKFPTTPTVEQLQIHENQNKK